MTFIAIAALRVKTQIELILMLLFVVWYLICFKDERVLYFFTFIQINPFPAFQENYHPLLICLCTLVAFNAKA